jgi:hypothetical protein
MNRTSTFLTALAATALVAFLNACSDQPKPEPQQAAPAPKSPAASPAQSATIKDWGPRETKRGEAVNRQPDGESAIWIGATGVAADPATKVRFGDRHAAPATVAPDLVTSAVPKEVIDTVGDYPVVIEEPSGRKTSVGTFRVLP